MRQCSAPPLAAAPTQPLSEGQHTGGGSSVGAEIPGAVGVSLPAPELLINLSQLPYFGAFALFPWQRAVAQLIRTAHACHREACLTRCTNFILLRGRAPVCGVAPSAAPVLERAKLQLARYVI